MPAYTYLQPLTHLMKFYLPQWEVTKVKSLINFDMTLTVLNLQQKRPKGAKTKIQVKELREI